MNKQRLFLDFDSTIVDSIKAYCQTYSELYSTNPAYIPPDHTKVQQWNLKDQCPLEEHVEDIFSSASFFDNLELYPDAKRVIEKLCEKYEVYCVSIGTPLNLHYKSIYLQHKLPCIKNYILLYNGNCTMDKSIVAWKEDDIFLDDVVKNLDSARNKFENKYIYGEEKSWNAGSNYKRLLTWNDVENELLIKERSYKPSNKFELVKDNSIFGNLSLSNLCEPQFLITCPHCKGKGTLTNLFMGSIYKHDDCGKEFVMGAEKIVRLL